jgi:plastocyanin
MYNVTRYAYLQAICVLLFRLSALADDVNGATGAVNSTTPSTVENEITVHTITVGEKQHFFTPNSINALPGDIVTFRFWPGNHSVIRAEFGYPCIPYEELRDSDRAGFYSGVHSPGAVDVVKDTVGVYVGFTPRPDLNVSAASNMELDNQHNLSSIFLLWRTR